MRRKKNKFSLGKFIADGWHDLKVKIVVLVTLFISVLLVIIIVALEKQKDRQALLVNANKYETYVDRLLLKNYSEKELENMASEELKIVIDRLISQELDNKKNLPQLNDFLFPGKEDDYSVFFKQIRPKKESWTQEEIESFWQNMDEIKLEELHKKNYDYLKAKLRDVN